MRFLVFPLALVMLAGCADPNGQPGFLGTGYHNHHQKYHAPSGRVMPDVGYEYDKSINDDVMTVWSMIATELVDGLENNTGLHAPRNVYVEALPDANAFNRSYEYSLRGVLREKGYNLVSSPEGATHIRFEAYRPEDADLRKQKYYQDEEHPELVPYYRKHAHDFTFVLTAAENNQLRGQSYLNAPIPAFGYEADEGQVKPEERIRPVSKKVEAVPLSAQNNQ